MEKPWRSTLTGMAGKPAARNDAAGGETAIIVTEAQIVAHGQLFIGKEAADEPVEEAAEGRSLQPELLGEGVELAEGVVVVGSEQDVDVGIVGVRREVVDIVAIGGDRREGRRAEVVLDLERGAPVGGLAFVGAARSDRELAVERIADRRDGAAEAGQNVECRSRRKRVRLEQSSTDRASGSVRRPHRRCQRSHSEGVDEPRGAYASGI